MFRWGSYEIIKKMRKMIVGRNKLSHQAKGPMKNKEGPIKEAGPLKPNPSSHKSYPRTSFDPTTLVEEYFT